MTKITHKTNNHKTSTFCSRPKSMTAQMSDDLNAINCVPCLFMMKEMAEDCLEKRIEEFADFTGDESFVHGLPRILTN